MSYSVGDDKLPTELYRTDKDNPAVLKQILLPAARAGGAAFSVEMEAFAVAAHPADVAGGVAYYQGVVGNVFVDYGAGADKGVLPDADPADDGGVGADGGAFAYVGGQVFVFAVDGAAGIVYVGEYHRRPQKDVVFTSHSLVYGYVVLHFYVVAQHYAVGYKYVLAQIAAFAKFGARHDVTKMPHFAAFTQLGALVYYCSGVDHGRYAVVGCRL